MDTTKQPELTAKQKGILLAHHWYSIKAFNHLYIKFLGKYVYKKEESLVEAKPLNTGI